MAKKRPEFSFPELERRGRNAILRSTAEVQAEEALLAETGSGEPLQEVAPDLPAQAIPSSGPDAVVTGSDAPVDAGEADVPAPTRARVRAPKTSPITANPTSVVVERLRQKLRTKQHLSSYTFRFRPEELEHLDQLVAELNQTRSSKLSKNDLVRLALGWLLTDYEEYGPASLVQEVTRQD